MINLENLNVIVTGAGSGFGAGISQACHAAGARLGLVDINLESAPSMAAELGRGNLALEADVSDRDSLAKALTTFKKDIGPIDVFVNNAGVGLSPTPLEQVSDADFDRVFAVNMRSIYLTSQLIVPDMIARGRGVILNIASTAGVSPRPGLTWYNASKGWVITATRSMAAELAEHNIRVNALNPVAGDTPMLKQFLGEDTPERRQAFLDTIPLGRFSTPQDLGQAAVFLCSEAASLITGVCMEVDGGRCI